MPTTTPDAPAPQLIELPSATARAPDARGVLFDRHLDLIQGVKVRLDTSLGQASLTVGELAGLQEGALLRLDRDIDGPVDILLDGRVVARGRLVAVDEQFGVCITELPQT